MASPYVNGGILLAANGEKASQWLKEIMQRATNLWPDAPPEVKELADLVIDGEIKQNYHSQDTSPKENPNERTN